MRPYDWDVFVSYERSGGCAGWVQKHFVDVFRQLLGNCVRHPRIFVDFEQARNGQNPADLVEVVTRSALLLAVWTPPYEDSQDCQEEWETMWMRQAGAAGTVTLVHTRLDGRHGAPITVRQRPCLVRAEDDLSDWSPCAFGQSGPIRARTAKRLQPLVQHIAQRLNPPPQSPPNPVRVRLPALSPSPIALP